jgi:hypothetical protein
MLPLTRARLSAEALNARDLTAIEQIARQLLCAEFAATDGLWQLQKQLLNLLLDIQQRASNIRSDKSAIRVAIARESKTRSDGWKIRLTDSQEQLRVADRELRVNVHLFKVARQLGDTFAWLLLGGEERRIFPVT